MDNIFRRNLKEQKNLPGNILFRKDRIYHSIETKINFKSNSKWQFVVAILLLMICSSAYWNFEQQQIIIKQNTILHQQHNQISVITNENKTQKSVQQSLIDSLSFMRHKLKNQSHVVRLEPLPKIVVNQPIVFKTNKEPDIITIRHITHYKTQKKEETKLPELDLPVVYESENLANNTMETSGSSSLSKKISKLLKN